MERRVDPDYEPLMVHGPFSEPDRNSAFPCFPHTTYTILINLLHFVQMRVISRNNFEREIFLIGNRCYERVPSHWISPHRLHSRAGLLIRTFTLHRRVWAPGKSPVYLVYLYTMIQCIELEGK
jgi:hypothetical protein